MTTIAQAARIRGFKANLLIRGRRVTTDSLDEQNKPQVLTVLIKDEPTMADPDKPAQAKQPVYTTLTALAGSVTDPRAVQKFTEEDGRLYRVLRYEETVADLVTWKWYCESQRV